MLLSRYWQLLLCILTAFLLCVDATTGGWSLHLFATSLLAAFLLSCPTSFVHRPLRAVVQVILGETVVCVCLVDCYCQLFLGSPITPQILNIIIQSNWRESGDFFSAFIGSYVFMQWRIIGILTLALLFPIALLIKWPFYFLPKTKKNWNIGVSVLITICLACETLPAYRFYQLFAMDTDAQRMEGLIFRHYHEEIPTPLHRIFFAGYSLSQSRRMLESVRQTTLNAIIDSCSHRSPHVVLIIGESYNKHHSTLFGYAKPTTPLQQEREAKDELYVFRDVVTPWNITSNVFLNLFSTWQYGDGSPVGSCPLFPVFFRQADYAVSFFSNQYLLKGLKKGATNQMGNFFLSDPELNKYMFSFRNRSSERYDMAMVKQVADVVLSKDRPAYTLDIIHLIGQHFEYAERYPANLAYFEAQDYTGMQLSLEAMQTKAHYDNATRYNDMVLDSLLSLYEHEDAVVVFIADHGEEVYDELPVHGRLFQQPTPALARQEFEVPMWIWCSENYRQNHQEIVVKIKCAVEKPMTTGGISHLLLYLAGIKCRWTTEQKNVLSPCYQCRPRLIAGEVDYDELLK